MRQRGIPHRGSSCVHQLNAAPALILRRGSDELFLIILEAVPAPGGASSAGKENARRDGRAIFCIVYISEMGVRRSPRA
ncbi:hypothetical protein [Pseudolabrys sp. FHR47]|uniref:hypothetical protein n=1 Tax=Pseudolabrys sp. FHR47 TaxID=2562284 RepID=UPI0010BE3E18|nr:hypothetical protein [Pseudolabrys sp. FHR47]